MRLQILLCFFIFTLFTTENVSGNATLPTLYEYYTEGGIHSGLEANNPDHFTLNSKPLVIYSGTLHYFRVVPEHWSQMLLRYKAAGLNSVQFYLPWNQHEEIPGKFDFESAFLNLEKFLRMIKEADMFAVVRPGPYICAEWDFGGLPSWLLHDPQMFLRSNYEPYRARVKLFWEHAMKIINKHQFSVSGGPVIMLQIENEYSQYLSKVAQSREYLQFLQNITRESGFKELLFASDPGNDASHYPIKGIFSHDSVLETINENRNVLNAVKLLKQHQPGKPVYISEFWSGWYDRWNITKGQHREYDVIRMTQEMEDTLFTGNGSLNLYPFVGGTNWGFMSAKFVTTSWDFDAALTINGNYTPKYHKTRELYEKLVSTGRHPKIHIPNIPPAPISRAYAPIKIVEVLPFEKILDNATKYVNVHDPEQMEWLKAGKDYGQRYGFVMYRVESKTAKQLEILGRINDIGIVLVDNHEITALSGDKHFTHSIEHSEAGKTVHIDLLVENMGRPTGSVPSINHAYTGLFSQDGKNKAQIKLDQQTVHNITVYSLDFEKHFVESLKSGWQKYNHTHKYTGPAMYRAELKIDGAPVDTFVQLPGWSKGNVFVNGFNLGRYWHVGPQQTLYLPGPLLKSGTNLIELFELHKPATEVHFADRMVWTQPGIASNKLTNVMSKIIYNISSYGN